MDEPDHQHPPLSACKEAQLAAVENDLARSEFAQVLFEGHAFEADAASFAALLAALSFQLPEDYYWVAADNTRVPMNKERLQALAQAVFDQRFAAFDLHQRRKRAVQSAQTVAELFL